MQLSCLHARRYSSAWDEADWAAVHSFGYAYLLELPFPPGTPPDPLGAPRVVLLSTPWQIMISSGLSESHVITWGLQVDLQPPSTSPACAGRKNRMQICHSHEQLARRSLRITSTSSSKTHAVPQPVGLLQTA